EQLARRAQLGQHLTLEVLAVPHVEHPAIEHEEPGVDAVVGEHGLLPEVPHATVAVDLERAVLRRQRHRRERRRAGMRPVEVEQRGEVDVTETVDVGGEEGLADEVTAAEDAPAGVRLLAGVVDVHVPTVGEVGGELLDEVAPVAGGEDEAGEPLAGEDLHHVLEHGTAVDLEERLGQLDRVRVGAGALPAAQDHGFDHAHRCTRSTAGAGFPCAGRAAARSFPPSRPAPPPAPTRSARRSPRIVASTRSPPAAWRTTRRMNGRDRTIPRPRPFLRAEMDGRDAMSCLSTIADVTGELLGDTLLADRTAQSRALGTGREQATNRLSAIESYRTSAVLTPLVEGGVEVAEVHGDVDAPPRPVVLHVLEAVGGGTARHLLDIVRHTPEFEHHVAVPSRRVGGLNDEHAAERMREAGAQVHIVEMRRAPVTGRNARALLALLRLVHTHDVDIVHGHSSVGGALARLAAARTGRSCVYTANGLATGRCALAIERRLARLTSRIVAVSASEAQLLHRRSIAPLERISVIPNGIE